MLQAASCRNEAEFDERWLGQQILTMINYLRLSYCRLSHEQVLMILPGTTWQSPNHALGPTCSPRHTRNILVSHRQVLNDFFTWCSL